MLNIFYNRLHVYKMKAKLIGHMLMKNDQFHRIHIVNSHQNGARASIPIVAHCKRKCHFTTYRQSIYLFKRDHHNYVKQCSSFLSTKPIQSCFLLNIPIYFPMCCMLSKTVKNTRLSIGIYCACMALKTIVLIITQLPISSPRPRHARAVTAYSITDKLYTCAVFYKKN